MCFKYKAHIGETSFWMRSTCFTLMFFQSVCLWLIFSFILQILQDLSQLFVSRTQNNCIKYCFCVDTVLVFPIQKNGLWESNKVSKSRTNESIIGCSGYSGYNSENKIVFEKANKARYDKMGKFDWDLRKPYGMTINRWFIPFKGMIMCLSNSL